MCLNPRTIILKPDSSRSLVLQRFYPLECFDSPCSILVPCGKCLECLEHRQNNIMARVYNEAKAHKRVYFLTLTYRERNLPIGHSIWRCNRDSGEYEQLSEVEVIDGTVESEFRDMIHDELDSASKLNKPRVVDIPIESYNVLSESNDYYDRYTPSLNPHDFQTILKLWRVRCERKFGKLPDFKYCIVGEYGTRKTCRPHYHCVLISDNLNQWQVKYLGNLWRSRFGNYDLRCPVCRIDSASGRDNYSCIAKYIGKYLAKGPFELQSVRDGLTVRTRFCASKGFGSVIPKVKIAEYLCKDMFSYDLWHAHEQLSNSQLDVLVRNIAKRSFYQIIYKVKQGKKKFLKVPLPMSFKRVIYESYIDDSGAIRWPPLYYLVSRYLRNMSVERDIEEFESFKSAYVGRPIFEVSALFASYKELLAKTRREVIYSRVKEFYTKHSKVF